MKKRPNYRKLRCVCKVCGKTVVAKTPRNGDGTWWSPVKHKSPESDDCEGRYMDTDLL